jgi:hypothetical protein
MVSDDEEDPEEMIPEEDEPADQPNLWRPRFLISLNSRSNGQQWSNHGQPGPSPRKTH